MARNKSRYRNQQKENTMSSEEQVSGQDEETVLEESDYPQAEDMTPVEVEAENNIVQEPMEESPVVATLSDLKPLETPEEMKETNPPLVNTIQNLASNTKVPTWDNTDVSNTLYGVLENVLNNYEKAMKAKMPVNREVGAQKQTELYQIIVRVAQSRNHFTVNWELILKHFHENPTGCYSANYVMRFLDGMKVTKNDITLFTRLLNLIMFTADPAKIRESLRRVSVEKTLSNVSSPIMRANITGYYRNFVS